MGADSSAGGWGLLQREPLCPTSPQLVRRPFAGLVLPRNEFTVTARSVVRTLCQRGRRPFPHRQPCSITLGATPCALAAFVWETCTEPLKATSHHTHWISAGLFKAVATLHDPGLNTEHCKNHSDMSWWFTTFWTHLTAHTVKSETPILAMFLMKSLN